MSDEVDFDDHGEPTASVESEYGPTYRTETANGPVDREESEFPPSEIAIHLLRLLCAKEATRSQIGARALLLLYAMRKGDFKSKAELARRMGVSRQRVAETLAVLKRDFPMLMRLC